MAVSDQIVARTAEHVRRTLANDTTGHDWWHIDRVRRNALRIAAVEKADLLIVELAALLHDIADWKFHGGDETAGPRAAQAWLVENDVNPVIVDAVCDIVARVTFKGAGVSTEMPTIEGKCVQDGDRLDAIGAIGIARAFTYGGHMGRLMHDPLVPPQLHSSFAAYKSKSGPTINHFYEKLLLLKDRMQTDTGRRIAEDRHQFMQHYLKQFLAEWDGSDASPRDPARDGTL